MRLSDRIARVDQQPARAIQGAPAGTKSRPARARRTSWGEAKRTVRDKVLAEIGPKLAGPKPISGEALEREVKACLDRILRREEVRVSPAERVRFVAEVMSDTLGYGPLDGPLADPSITEIMCNSHDEIWIERNGLIETTDLSFADESQYRHVIDKIVVSVGRRVDEASPMADARLPNGSRVNVIIPPLALRGPVLTVRKFAESPYTAKDLVTLGTMSLDFVVATEACIRGKTNVLISGGTGTGKTTLLNALSAFIPEKERIVTIEDAAELQLQQPHVVPLEARPPNAEGRGEVRIRDLVRNALRMRPDRIVVGEVRGPEALDMLQAMNTGHEGSMTTIHSNSARDALSRLETMVLMAGFDLPVRAIREQVASAIHVIIQLDRMTDGTRKVTSVHEVQGLEGDTILLQEIFRFRPNLTPEGRQIGEMEATGLRPRFADRLAANGIELPAKVFHSPRPGRVARTDGAPTSGPRRLVMGKGRR